MDHKVVVFDVDETLGYFVQFGILWDVLCQCQYIDSTKKQQTFNECFELYPEFIRPNMIPILAYLKDKIQVKQCKKVMMYNVKSDIIIHCKSLCIVNNHVFSHLYSKCLVNLLNVV
jgi:hypothetical protein